MENKDVGYRRTYKLRYSTPNANCIEVTFPSDVVEREANRRNITVREFIGKYCVLAEYDGFEGVRYTFKEKGEEDAK